MTVSRDLEVQNLLDFLDCPLRHFSTNHVPEAEIHCPYDSCLSGPGVAGAGVCGDGDPRQADCTGYRKTCQGCGGDGGWDGERERRLVALLKEAARNVGSLNLDRSAMKWLNDVQAALSPEPWGGPEGEE